MSRPPVFLGVEHVLASHRRMIAEFGGSAELRDYGLLEAAAMMPAAPADVCGTGCESVLAESGCFVMWRVLARANGAKR